MRYIAHQHIIETDLDNKNKTLWKKYLEQLFMFRLIGQFLDMY